jgi:YD repeat-containing protein
MVAIVTGNALGLSTSSLADLGQQGARGSAAVGRNGDMAYVNAATGNLVLQTQDELLVGRGLSIESLRTYNSRGLFNDDNGDNWSMGVYAQQLQRVETPPLSGRYKFVRTDRDGAQSTYVFSSGGWYECKDGDGAFDRIYATASTWTWEDGNSGRRETYDVNTGRLMSVADKSGNALTYAYDGGGRLASVKDANGDQTYYDYVGNQLRQIRTGYTKDSQFVSQTRVRYEYDTSNRLWKVTVDLTPEIASDNRTFVTTYSYDGTSKRVASITHNNDTVLRLQYDATGRVQYAYDALDKRTEYRYEATGRTRVIDPVGAECVYEYFATGQLKSVTSLAGGAVVQTITYSYDANGDVTSVTDGQNNVTTFLSDSRGNTYYQRDAAGNTITRYYNFQNQLERESRYFVPNPSNPLNASNGTHMTTRYVYDDAGLNRLRFFISAEGRVTEYRYDAYGQRIASLTYATSLYPATIAGQSSMPTEASMANFVRYSWNQVGTDVQRTDMAYDARGQLQKTTVYAATDYYANGVANGSESVTHYVYDQSGRLLQTISPTGGVTSMSYDGMGRIVSRAEANGPTTLMTYADASNIVEQTISQTGLKTTSVYDKAGRLVSVQQTNAAALGLGDSTYAYDANGRLLMTTDPTGSRHWMLYDEAGRKVADIDGSGSLVEYSYNRSGQLTRTVAYATAVNTAALVDGAGKPTAPVLSTLRPSAKPTDVYQWNAYDKAGRLVKAVNAEGAVSETFYDGADRIVKVTQYAARISTGSLGVAPTPESIAPALDAARDRSSRFFYDSQGLLLGELDAEGYLVEYRYNVAGQRNWTLRYTTQAGAAQRASGTLPQLIAALGGSGATKASTVNYFNNKGQVIAEVDPENYLTEFEYDKNGNLKRRVRYSRAYTGSVSPSTSVASFKQQWQYQPPYTQPESQVTTWQYDQLNRVTLMTEPDGTVTKYDYDAVGNLVRTTRAYGQGTEERALNARYDAQGRLAAELAATEAWRLTTGMTDAQAAAIFEQYGVKHTYDKAGRRISTSDRNGLTTLYFYNEDSQLTHSVNAMGEVEERRYNALGQLEATLRYGLRLDSSTRSQLRSGTTSIASAVAAIADAAKDSKTTFEYKLSGRVASSSEQLKPGSLAVVHHVYDAFGGEIERRTELGDGTGRIRLDTMAYDRRGLQTRNTLDAGGAAIDTTVEYDAFGRAIKTWDDAGKLTETGYDKLGRVISTADRHGIQYQRKTTYDAFDRVLTQTDALGKVTTYTHNTAARSVTMTTPESVKVTTVYNRHGQTLSITDGKLQTTSYTYDKDGNLTGTTAPIASASTNQTFERGRLIEAFDANDTKVKYTYDDANRVLSREVDPDGLKLLTKYEYDSSGRQVKVTDPAGVVTRLEYDLAGRQVAQTVDEGAAGLNLRTEYTHDASGRVLTVTSPGNRVTQYKYDALGRRTEEIVDPAGLMLRTVYTYDHDGNVRTRTDANGAVSGFAYDAEGWLQYSVDGAGGVTYHEYDKMGRVTRTTRYAEAISIAGLTAQFTSADIAARVVKKPGKDAIEARSYDGDGRLRFTADGNGAVVEYRYDKNGNVTDRIAYAKAINVAAWTAGNPPVVNDASDQRLRNEYDALNRLTYQADATGAVTRREYDDNGNLRRLTEYATKLTGPQTPGQATGQAGDRVTVFVYDKANREIWRVDATGAAQKSEYDNDGHLIARTSYFNTVTAGTEPTSIAVHAHDRTERYTYDGAGRRVFGVDAMNCVTRWTYDDVLGRRTVTRFATAIPTGGNPADVKLNAASDQTDVYLEDKAGRVVSHTDAEGNTESWVYDAVGNKKTFTNKKGSVWQYEYDAAGRLTRETSPEVYLTTVTASALGSKLLQGASADAVLKTRFEYDALGNLLRRTEAEGRKDAEGRSEERTTIYEYDARGRQVKVTYPPVLLHGEPTERALVAQTFYDALGNAVANIDVAGKTSYKVYDLAGRVRYEVDTVGHVTGYERNTFGEAEKVTRYAVRTGLPTQTTAAAVALLPSANATKAVEDALKPLDHTHDRSISSTYDKLGRVIQVREGTFYTFDSVTRASKPDAKKTAHTYNAFGDVVKTRVSGLADTEAVDTYFYYDRLGHQVAQVDALGYVTVREFDATGNMTASTEFAGKLNPGGWNAEAHGLPLPSADDRETTWTYDRLNRKTTETRVGVSFAANAAAIPAGQPAVANIVTQYGYDALGNLTRTLDANGGEVLSYYDALGRVTAVVSPAAQGVNGTVRPLSVFLRDAYGNVVVKWDLANGAAQAEEFRGVSRESAAGFTLGAPDADKDRRTVTRYDRMGRAIQTTDAEGNSQFSAYLANGQVGKTWQFVTDIDGQRGQIYQIFDYDELGRLVATREPAPTNFRGDTDGAETRTQLEYNAFGEITERKVDGKLVEYFEYDDVGLLWRSNSGDGVARVMFYDVHGRATAEVRSRGADFGVSTGPDYRGVDLKTAFASASDVKNAVVAGDERLRYTLTEYDALGRVTKQTQPLRTETPDGLLDAVQMKTQDVAKAVVSGTTAATLTWGSLASLGAGEVRVTLTYTAEVPTGPALEPELERQQRTRTQIFGAEQSAEGVVFSWTDAEELLTEVHNFVVEKKDANGIYRVVLDRPIGAKLYSVEVALPPDPAASVRFETKVGDGNWIQQTSGIRFGSVLRFDLAQLGSSSFSYRVFYDKLDAQTGVVTRKTEPDTNGQFTISGAPVLEPISLEGGFQMPGVSQGVLAWTKPPAGTTQVLNYRPIGGNWHVVDTVYDVSATLSGADAAVLPDGEYEYELLWTPANQPLPTSHATGTFKVTAAVTERQASGTPSITGIDVNSTTVSWDTRIDTTAIVGTPRFEWRLLPDTEWTSITKITTANDRASVDIKTFNGGVHEFRITYELNGEQTALGTVRASLGEPDFRNTPQPILSSRLTVAASGFAVNSAGDTLSWINTGTNCVPPANLHELTPASR